MLYREITTSLMQTLDEFRILYLTGPRQAGKTTVAKHVAALRNMRYITLDDAGTLAAVESDPQGFLAAFGDANLVIDEFQYAPSLVYAVKQISDQLPPSRRGKFLLTGSADIFRSAHTQESLPGHMARVELYPLSVTEKLGLPSTEKNIIDYLFSAGYLNDTPNENDASSIQKPPMRTQLAEWVLAGGFPEVQSKSLRSQSLWYSSYIQGRLLKDFESIYTARGDYHAKLLALIPYLAGLSGNLLKYASVGNDLAQDSRVVKSYMDALEWMFLIKRLSPYTNNLSKREVVGMHKLHLIDTGLACHLLGLRTVDQLLFSSQYGGLLENFVLMELYKHLAYSDEIVSLHHFRDTQRNEVDIVLAGGGLGAGNLGAKNIVGIEIKASSSVSAQDFKGLSQLAEYAGSRFKHGLLLYSGDWVLPFKIEGRTFHAVPFAALFRA